jgi:tetratricopeptide (TPR) repeat protein/S1-C subfamily serine protease
MTARKFAARILAAATLALPLTFANVGQAQTPTPPSSSRPAEADAKLTAKQVTEIGMHGACWILNGTVANHRMHGSGWVLDAKKRLIVTNDHVVQGNDAVSIFFPVWEAGKVNRDPQHYMKSLKPIRAIVIDRDKNRDLALLQVEEIPAGTEALKLAAESAEEGDILRTVGGLPNGNEALWGTVSGEVRLVAPRNHPNGGRCMMVTTTIPTNGGNSGGAILNERGEVAAVVEGGYDGPNAQGRMVLSVTMHVDLSVLKEFLNNALPLVSPSDAETFVKRGERRMAAGRIDAAAGDFAEAIKKDRKNIRARLGRGKAFVAKGDFVTAIGDFDAVIAEDGESFEAYIARGRAKAAMKKTDEAIADMTQAIRIEAGVRGYNERGNIFHAAGKFGEAVEDYTRAINIAPNDIVLLTNRAASYEGMSKFAEAVADRKRVIDLEPNSDWRWSELGRTYLWKAHQLQDAFNAFKKAAQMNPKEPIHVADMADTVLLDDQFEKAVTLFTEALNMNRERPSLNVAYTTCRRGVARKNLKQNDAALEDFNQAIRIDPKYSFAYLERGRLFKAMGKNAEGQADLDQAIKLNPSLAADAGKSIDSDTSLVGTWVFNGTVNGVANYERATLRADGTIVTKIGVRQRNGFWLETEDSGTYKIVGNRLIVSFRILGEIEGKFERNGNTVRVTMTDGRVTTYTLQK